MKRLQITLVLSLFVLIGLVAMSFALVNKVEPGIKSKVITTTEWHFTGNDPLEILNPANWEEGPSPDMSCQDTELRELPCTYVVDDENIANPTELMEYFEDKYITNIEDQVVADAESTRNPQP